MTASIPAEVHARCGARIGESPLYDSSTSTLYWIDIPAGVVWRERSGETESWDVGDTIGAIAQIDGGGFLLALRAGVSVVSDWAGQQRSWIELEPELPTRLNDGKCDSAGRFVVGTVAPKHACDGALYLIDDGAEPRQLLDGVALSNGLGWSPDDRTLYFVDSLAGSVTSYPWDAAGGAIVGAGTTLMQMPPEDGRPDGLTVDADGGIWVAIWGAGEVRRYAPDGEVTAVVTLPTPNVASCAFGGPDNSTLFITTASAAIEPDDPRAAHAGDVFRAAVGVVGMPTHRFARASVPAALLA